MHAHNKEKEENLYTLIGLKQSQGEKLEVFEIKFLELAQKVDNLNQKIVILALTNALQINYKVKEHLFLDKPSTLEDIITKVNGYVDLERIMTERIETSIRLNFEASNNVIEYEALIHGLDMALEIGVPELLVYTDSLLIIHHYTEQYKKNGKMINYAALVVDKMSRFIKDTLDYLLRRGNRHANSLAYLAGVLGTQARYLKIEVILAHNIDLPVVCAINTGAMKRRKTIGVRELIGLLRTERTGCALEEEICYRAILFGIMKASLNTQSFISEASFQETARVLAKAALRVRIDWLKGLKEIIVLGVILHVGTGFKGLVHRLR
ncbi:hypothetical protein GIB67_016439 [Kingdonia uniflora]|uniref:RNase H type-1 domain-containing protein n=1 Tax=Kingdonia uniflora TaxID=39325 RepID=A0A7J7MH38_9MAGN|nr:hypothetical protein GIB67_016439 [Kingdonia uniflora]